MYKKILNVLTAVSALAVAGLLSIIPASVSCAAAPSQPVSQVQNTIQFNDTIEVLDWRGTDIEPTFGIIDTSERPTSYCNKSASFEFTFSGLSEYADWRNSLSLRAQFHVFSSAYQLIQVNVDVPYESMTNQAEATGTFRFVYDNNGYSGNLRLTPVQSSPVLGVTEIDDYNNFTTDPTPSAPPQSSSTAEPWNTAEPSYTVEPWNTAEPESTGESTSTEEPSSTDESASTAESEATTTTAASESSDDAEPVVPGTLVNPITPVNPENPSGHIGGGEVPNDKAFYEEIERKVDEIRLASQGLSADGSPNPSRVVNYNTTGAISSRIIKALMNSEGVTLIYTFEYEGIIFRSVITSESARAMYSETIDWYGPCYVAIFCPPVPIGLVK